MPRPPATVGELRSLLAAHDVRLKKSLGQNFLVNDSILQRIVEAAEISPEDAVVEVGPGVGTLTYHLARAARQVVAVELDLRMVAILQETLVDCGNVRVVHGDILRLDLAGTLPGAPYKVVANIPYYITSAVIRRFLEHAPLPSLMALMVQHEVAQRILAAPGQMSILAVSVQFYAVPALALRVPAGAFYPAPQVDSALIRMVARADRPAVDPQRFFRAVHAGFGQKRKQLRNALAAGLRISGTESEALLGRADIDPERRAQTLTIEEWARLAGNLPVDGAL